MKNNNQKIRFLEEVASTYDASDKNEFDFYYRKFHYENIKSQLSGNKFLEFGSGTGLSTYYLAKLSNDITVVEGSISNILKAKANFDLEKVNFINKLWEEYDTTERFTDIFFVDSLQLIENHKEMILFLSKYLQTNGRIHLIVPNAYSFHRLLGVEMGLISSVTDLSPNDKKFDSFKNFSWSGIRELISDVELNIVHESPILFKPFDGDTLLNLTEKQIEGLFKIASEFKEYCSHMYFVVKK